MGPAHLVLAGPSVDGVADDPEAAEVLDDCLVPVAGAARRRTGTGSTWPACPMTDGDEAAAVVNALQRHAAVVVQKSLAEGFGLTVAEAMWKARPVVGQRGRRHRRPDRRRRDRAVCSPIPYDLAAFAAAVAGLLADPAEADRMGATAELGPASSSSATATCEQWAQLLAQLLAQRG